jgi:hypothetical protein
VVRYGPFVMTTNEEISTTLLDCVSRGLRFDFVLNILLQINGVSTDSKWPILGRASLEILNKVWQVNNRRVSNTLLTFGPQRRLCTYEVQMSGELNEGSPFFSEAIIRSHIAQSSQKLFPHLLEVVCQDLGDQQHTFILRTVRFYKQTSVSSNGARQTPCTMSITQARVLPTTLGTSLAV